MAEVEINGMKLRALKDSGATKSNSTISLVENLRIKLKSPDNRRKWLMADNSSNLAVMGTAYVRLKLKKCVILRSLKKFGFF